MEEPQERFNNLTRAKERTRFDVRKYSFSRRTINELNIIIMSTDCVGASSVNVSKKIIGKCLIRTGHTKSSTRWTLD